MAFSCDDFFINLLQRNLRYKDEPLVMLREVITYNECFKHHSGFDAPRITLMNKLPQSIKNKASEMKEGATPEESLAVKEALDEVMPRIKRAAFWSLSITYKLRYMHMFSEHHIGNLYAKLFKKQ